MKKFIILILLIAANFNSYCQETYKDGKTEYYYNQYYSTTGKPVVKRSEHNKKVFLKSQGYKTIPSGYQIDHIQPLSEGGSDDPENMQLLTINQHKEKTARERTNRSNSNLLHTKPSIENSIFENKYGELITKVTYSRTDLNGKLIYIKDNGTEYYFNDNGRKINIKEKKSYEISTTKKLDEPTKVFTINDLNRFSEESYLKSLNTPSTIQPIQISSDLPVSSPEVHTGPRGGTYIINGNGNKTYIPR